MTPSNTARIEENLRKVLEETDLTRFENIFIFQLILTRLEHFNAVNDTELEVFKKFLIFCFKIF
jgi:hypothetical protein